MKFAHFRHVWAKPGMTPHRRDAELWRQLTRSIRLLGERVIPALRDDEPF